MPDLLCSLVDLPPVAPLLEDLRGRGVTVRRPNPWEQTALRDFILRHFTVGWADETAVAFHHQPVTAFVAHAKGAIIGFAAYECTRRNYFGPTGVDPAWRGAGVGKALFLASMAGLRELGYTYAIVGDAGPVDFYRKAVGAMEIPLGGGHGIYPLAEDPMLRSLR
ncbi:GNAT family N-acetyltransferase [bacterium]|nr:GNAT family N-acetyltransferase [bacterium]